MPRPIKRRFQESKVKTMLVLFFDYKGILHKESPPPNQTVNKDLMQESWTTFWNGFNSYGRNCTRKWIFSCCTIIRIPHTTMLMQQFLAQKHVTILHHSPKSPDLSLSLPLWLFCISEIELHLKGLRFEDIESVLESKSISQNFLKISLK